MIFYMQINIKVSYKLISTLWVSKFRTRWYYHDQAFSSLQYLKKEARDGVHFFCRQINIKVSTTRHYHFWWKWPYMFKVPKVILLWCKTLRYFTEVQQCSLLFVLYAFWYRSGGALLIRRSCLLKDSAYFHLNLEWCGG